ncbi:MAG: HD-GYP domain-containing protein [Planctomycetota bacterium]|jgi:HD-GYP domain-containing protein (c-di-GMP phosphodiesterase class II)
MTDLERRVQDVERAEELIRKLASALSARRIYSLQHPRVKKAVRAFAAAFRAPSEGGPAPTRIQVTVTGHALEYESMPIADNTATLRLAMCLEVIECSGVEFTTAMTNDSASELLELLLNGAPIPADGLRLTGIELFPRGQDQKEDEERDFPPLPEFDVPLLVYRSALDVLDQTMARARATDEIPMDDIEEVALWTAEETFAQGSRMVAPTQIVRQDKHTWQHSVNVFLIATTLLQPFARDPRELARFGQAAFLHDIGKSRIPREILRKKERLTEEEFAVMRRHPEHAVEILASCPDVDPLALEVAYCHHMRDDGHGYPQALEDVRPGPISDIVQVADMFEALTALRPYKGGLSVAEAVRTILHTEGMGSKRSAIGLLVRRLTVAPPGSEVVLHTGEHAIVLDIDEDRPSLPVVKFITDEHGTPLDTPFVVDLREQAPEGDVRAGPIRKVLLRPAFSEL